MAMGSMSGVQSPAEV